MAQQSVSPVVLEGVQIIFRNFAGKEGPYNKEGTRNFGVILPPEAAEDMARIGWNVKVLRAREVDDGDDLEERPWLPVDVRFDVFPPQIYLVTSKNRTLLGENQIEQLDWVEMVNVDLIVRPYEWELNGKTGVKAYVKTMFVTINEDPLMAKYAEQGA